MRVGYDARILASRRMTGIGQYTYNLIKALAATAGGDRLTLFFPGRCPRCPISSKAIRQVHSIVPPDLREDRFYRLWFDIYLPLRVRLGGIDVFHGPSFLIPRVRRARMVVTVHDLAHEKYPRMALGCSAEFSRRARESVQRADAVIAVSRRTRDDILELYGIDERRVRVIYEGVDPLFRPVRDDHSLSAFRRKYRLPERFILSVISLHPRKNMPGLLRAFSRLKERASLPHSLVVTGKDYGQSDLRRVVEESGVGQSFMFLDYLPREELPFIYSLADAFVFPPLYEGFGLPPLEAMACGTPVAASRAGSLPEVLGDAALYFDPEDPEEMAERMRELLSSAGERDRLRARGYERAKKYRWTDCARRTLQLYREIV